MAVASLVMTSMFLASSKVKGPGGRGIELSISLLLGKARASLENSSFKLSLILYYSEVHPWATPG